MSKKRSNQYGATGGGTMPFAKCRRCEKKFKPSEMIKGRCWRCKQNEDQKGNGTYVWRW